jgi:hypothetical protein
LKVRWFNFGVGEQQKDDGTVVLVKHPDQVLFAESPRFVSDCTLQIWYRMKLDTTERWKIVQLVRSKSAPSAGVISDARYDLYSEPLPLPREKIADLAKFKV